jgi:hypothetical protein
VFGNKIVLLSKFYLNPCCLHDQSGKEIVLPPIRKGNSTSSGCLEREHTLMRKRNSTFPMVAEKK